MINKRYRKASKLYVLLQPGSELAHKGNKQGRNQGNGNKILRGKFNIPLLVEKHVQTTHRYIQRHHKSPGLSPPTDWNRSHHRYRTELVLVTGTLLGFIWNCELVYSPHGAVMEICQKPKTEGNEQQFHYWESTENIARFKRYTPVG